MSFMHLLCILGVSLLRIQRLGTFCHWKRTIIKKYFPPRNAFCYNKHLCSCSTRRQSQPHTSTEMAFGSRASRGRAQGCRLEREGCVPSRWGSHLVVLGR